MLALIGFLVLASIVISQHMPWVGAIILLSFALRLAHSESQLEVAISSAGRMHVYQKKATELELHLHKVDEAIDDAKDRIEVKQKMMALREVQINTQAAQIRGLTSFIETQRAEIIALRTQVAELSASPLCGDVLPAYTPSSTLGMHKQTTRTSQSNPAMRDRTHPQALKQHPIQTRWLTALAGKGDSFVERRRR